MRKLLLTGLVAWTARWVALEVAAYLGHRLPPTSLDDPGRPPGWMPRRADSLKE